MSGLLHLEEKLRTTGAALGRLESEFVRVPASKSLRSNILSLRKLHENLRAEYDEVANQLGVDVLHYRILEDRPTARTLAESIYGFQEAFSLVYDARQNGPKMRRVLIPEIVKATELHAAYTYPGSFGIVFTIPNQRLLLPEFVTSLEIAAGQVIGLAKAAKDPERITEAAKVLGKAPIAALYEWSKNCATAGVGAEITWRRESETREHGLVQAREFAAVSEAIEKKSETLDSTLVIEGTLVGADTRSKRFHFVADADGPDSNIRGKFSDAISETQKAQLPQRYRATVMKTAKVSFVTDEEKATYFLLRLERLHKGEENIDG